MTLTQWPPQPPAVTSSWPQPSMSSATGRSLLGCCPACGQARLFKGCLRLIMLKSDTEAG